MSERKVINKYYPPDYDPSKITKKKKKVKTGTASLPVVRVMSPFSMKCLNCGDYISKSRKFNARKETTDETYLGIKIIRLHIKCPSCASEIIYKTDPKSGDYILILGAQKNYDSGRNQELQDETIDQTLARLEKEEEEHRLKEAKDKTKQTTLEDLEAKLDSIRHQQELNDEIEEIQLKNTKLNSLDLRKQKLLEIELLKKQQEEEDQKLIEQAFKEKSNASPSSDSESDSDYDQPITTTLPNLIPSKIVKKKTNNLLGISRKK